MHNEKTPTAHKRISITPAKLRSDILGMSQQELAHRLRVSPRTLSRWESGKIPTSRIMQLEGVARCLNYPVVAEGDQIYIVLATTSATTHDRESEPVRSPPA